MVITYHAIYPSSCTFEAWQKNLEINNKIHLESVQEDIKQFKEELRELIKKYTKSAKMVEEDIKLLK